MSRFRQNADTSMPPTPAERRREHVLNVLLAIAFGLLLAWILVDELSR